MKFTPKIGEEYHLYERDGAKVLVYDNSKNILYNSKYFETCQKREKIVFCSTLGNNTDFTPSVTQGKKLNPTEMQALTNDLLACKQKTIDQSGKPIMVKLTKQSLERFFH